MRRHTDKHKKNETQANENYSEKLETLYEQHIEEISSQVNSTAEDCNGEKSHQVEAEPEVEKNDLEFEKTLPDYSEIIEQELQHISSENDLKDMNAETNNERSNEFINLSDGEETLSVMPVEKTDKGNASDTDLTKPAEDKKTMATAVMKQQALDLSAFGNRSVAPEDSNACDDLYEDDPADYIEQSTVPEIEENNAKPYKESETGPGKTDLLKNDNAHIGKDTNIIAQKKDNNPLIAVLIALCILFATIIILLIVLFVFPKNKQQSSISNTHSDIMEVYDNEESQNDMVDSENPEETLADGTNMVDINSATELGDSDNSIDVVEQNENVSDEIEADQNDMTITEGNDDITEEQINEGEDQSETNDTVDNQLPDYDIGEGPKGSAGRVYFSDGTSYALDWNGYSNSSPLVARHTESMMTVISGNSSHNSNIGDKMYITDEYGYTYEYQCISTGNNLPADGTLENTSAGNIAIEEDGGISYWNING